MKKTALLIVFSCFLFNCKQNDTQVDRLEMQIKALEQKLENVYTPGFGTLMGHIRTQHSKLWFSGINKNWELAEFNLHEIQERFEDIEKYRADKKEVQFVPMIEPVMDSLKNDIREKNFVKFEKNFLLLTNTCNSCHKLTKHDYIEIKIPDMELNFNQVFTPKNRN